MDVRDIPLTNLVKAPCKFNGGIFKFKGENYLTYRANWDPDKCKIFITKTDNDWNPIGSSWEVRIPILANLFEDPRFITIGDKPFLAVSQIDLSTDCQYQGLIELSDRLLFKRYIKIDYGDNWSSVERQSINKEDNIHYINIAEAITFEKNWCFLDNEPYPTFVYKTQPVTIVVETDFNFKITNEQGDARNFNWPFGEIRGGAPAIKVGDIYYHFFHSSTLADPYSETEQNNVGRIYYMGCYTFKRTNEHFELLQQSRIPLEMGDYTQRVELWRNAAVFPCGVVFESDKFYISYGWADYKLKLLTIAKKELDDLLTPLQLPVYLENSLINNNRKNNENGTP